MGGAFLHLYHHPVAEDPSSVAMKEPRPGGCCLYSPPHTTSNHPLYHLHSLPLPPSTLCCCQGNCKRSLMVSQVRGPQQCAKVLPHVTWLTANVICSMVCISKKSCEQCEGLNRSEKDHLICDIKRMDLESGSI